MADAKINLPRAAGTCTRVPIEVRLRQEVDKEWRCMVKIRWDMSENGEAAVSIYFQRPARNLRSPVTSRQPSRISSTPLSADLWLINPAPRTKARSRLWSGHRQAGRGRSYYSSRSACDSQPIRSCYQFRQLPTPRRRGRASSWFHQTACILQKRHRLGDLRTKRYRSHHCRSSRYNPKCRQRRRPQQHSARRGFSQELYRQRLPHSSGHHDERRV